jgi:hypothetical protein
MYKIYKFVVKVYKFTVVEVYEFAVVEVYKSAVAQVYKFAVLQVCLNQLQICKLVGTTLNL